MNPEAASARASVLRLSSCVLFTAVLAGGCGDDASLDRTLATLSLVRGDATVGDEPLVQTARAATQSLSVGDASLARLALDSGSRLLLDAGSEVAIEDEFTVSFTEGRLYGEAGEGELLQLSTAHGVTRARDAAFSARIDDGLRLYVVRGEVTFCVESACQHVGAGNELHATSAATEVTPVRLFQDWTGGLAQPGPADARGAAGLGVLEARVPDEVGLARWPLVIRRLDVRVRIEADLAVTEVEQVFFNPASETVEGTYRIRVPETAVLQRFAVDRSGRLVDGYVREKAQARQAYEAQVYRGSTLDPALLEWVAPGRYAARIYPIRPGETRRIVIRYAEWLAPGGEGGPRLYRYPMAAGRNAPHIQEMSLVVDLEGAAAQHVRAGMGAAIEEGRVALRRSDFAPHADFWLELDGGEPSQRAWRADHEPPPRAPDAAAVFGEADERDYWYLPLRLPQDLFADAQSDGVDLVIVADVSAATDREHLELGRTVAEALTAHLGPNDRLAIVTSDLAIRSVDGGPAALGDVSQARVDVLLDGLARVPAGGATDLGAALAGAASLLDEDRPGAVLYIGDGAPTVGELGAEGMLEHLARLPAPLRLYAVGVGAEANLDLLEAITRGGGLALRVEERSAAADAALRVLEHVARPAAHRVTVDLGPGIDNVYPRRPVDTVLGDVLPVSGRVRETPPTSVTVRGVIAGTPFERVIAISTVETEETTDLRLRWAGERLRQLLLEGAAREEVAELGTRYGMITPFTSFYVPSAQELGQMGASALDFIDRPTMFAERRRTRDWSAGEVALAVVLGPLSISGCMMSDDAEAVGSSSSPLAQGDIMEEATESAPPQPVSVGVAPGSVSPSNAPSGGSAAAPMDLAPSAEPAPPMEEVVERSQRTRRAPRGRADDAPSPVASGRRAPSRPRPVVVQQQGGEEQALLDGLHGDDETGAVFGSDTGRGSTASVALGGLVGRDASEVRVGGGDGWFNGEPLRTRVVVSTTPDSHALRRCSDAADQPLSDRRMLWGERLGEQASPGGWVAEYRRAIRSCEAPVWRDRRALLHAILQRAGSIERMVAVYRLFTSGSARGTLRAAILRRVRSPQDLRVARQAFGLGNEPDWTLVEQILERSRGEAGRVRALRRLVMQFPESFDLRLRLLEALEAAGLGPEARRLAASLRVDPRADAGIRTAIGEMYLRMEMEDEARRVFSEIVEFSPLDELARRRLGDLYRAHGWFEDAYRQYETLAQIRPDDPTALLLLAQAAAGTGRVDEALRLEQRLMETAQPGAERGIARVAQLWTSVRLAKLRSHARENSNDDRLEALERRMRRSGVLRGAGDLRATLAWSHPDAQLALYAAHPGQTLARPHEIAPEHGIEAFDVPEQEDGTYRVEVRRADPDAPTDMAAELILVWNEGGEDEVVRVVPLSFTDGRARYAFAIDGQAFRAE
ncbi:MAG: VIT domain-containing protein [Sandaracinaceae bacterium]